MKQRHRLRRLRVGIVAPPWVAVPPARYGGTEVVIDQLARGLTRAGHDVHLFTTGDSTCPVRRSWRYPTALGTEAALALELAHTRDAYHWFGNVDIVHDHTLTGPRWAHQWRPRLPVVTTSHGPFTVELVAHYAAVADHVAVIAISESQRASAPRVPIDAVIHHGVDIDAFPLGPGDGGYVLFLGRMSPDKGVHRAIAIARRAGRRLVIAAKMWEQCERRYFTDVVEPLLGPDAIFIGQVGGQRKLNLLAGASALLNPIRWPEPFGLVMIEALACGTPVLSFAEGAAPEIVEHGTTGFLCADEADMVARLDEVPSLDRRACRDSVARRFSAQLFVDRHVALYRRLIAAATDGAITDCPGVAGDPDTTRPDAETVGIGALRQ